jgi:hypothetical protein
VSGGGGGSVDQLLQGLTTCAALGLRGSGSAGVDRGVERLLLRLAQVLGVDTGAGGTQVLLSVSSKQKYKQSRRGSLSGDAADADDVSAVTTEGQGARAVAAGLQLSSSQIARLAACLVHLRCRGDVAEALLEHLLALAAKLPDASWTPRDAALVMCAAVHALVLVSRPASPSDVHVKGAAAQEGRAARARRAQEVAAHRAVLLPRLQDWMERQVVPSGWVCTGAGRAAVCS